MDLQKLTRMYDFTGRTIVITGAMGVLGGEMACALVGCGAHVVILDRNLEPSEGAAGSDASRRARACGGGRRRARSRQPAAVTDRRRAVRAHRRTDQRRGGQPPRCHDGPGPFFFDLPPTRCAGCSI